MPGIFALHLPPKRPDGAIIADRLAAAMTLFPWQQARVEEMLPQSLYLGVVVDRDRPQGAAGCHGRHGDLSCVTEGHIVRSRTDCGASAPLARGDYAEAALRAYATYGPNFATHLEGQYGILLVDCGSGRLIACHGRLGEKPLYLARPEGVTLFCSQLGPMASCGLWPTALDDEAVATFLAHGQPFGNRTHLRDVQIVATATTWELDLASGKARAQRYWTQAESGALEEHKSHAQHVADVADEVLAAARRTVRRRARYVAGLSGGSDTRIMVGLAAQLVPDLTAWTLGAPEASDVVVSDQIARKLGLKHWIYAARPDLVAEHAADFVATSDASLPVDWSYANARARDLRERGAEVVLNGVGGEVYMRGDFLTLRYRSCCDYLRYRLGRGPMAPHPWVERNHGDKAIARYIAAKFGQGTALRHLAVHDPPTIVELVLNDLKTTYHGMPPSAQVEEWIMEQRGRRRTVVSTNSDRHFYSDGSIFFDYDLLERCNVVPPRRKRFNRLFNDVLKRLLPDLARMVSANTGLPMTTPYWRFASRELVNRVLLRRGPGTFSTGIDADNWIRNGLRDFYGDVLHDERTRTRSYWDGDGLARLFDAHQNGASNVGADLGLPVTIELFARRWLDSPPLERPPVAQRIQSLQSS